MIPSIWLITGVVLLLVIVVGYSITSTTKKVWKAGDHRVVRKHQTLKHHHGYGIHKERTYYKCIDCERTGSNRKVFCNKKCYEVVKDACSTRML